MVLECLLGPRTETSYFSLQVIVGQSRHAVAERQLRPGKKGMILDQKGQFGFITSHGSVWSDDPFYADPSPGGDHQQPRYDHRSQEREGE
jgi:hypothetical protein